MPELTSPKLARLVRAQFVQDVLMAFMAELGLASIGFYEKRTR